MHVCTHITVYYTLGFHARAPEFPLLNLTHVYWTSMTDQPPTMMNGEGKGTQWTILCTNQLNEHANHNADIENISQL